MGAPGPLRTEKKEGIQIMKGRRPLISHPVFAAFIGLWCAALFGLVVFVLPDALLGRALSGFGLPGMANGSLSPVLRLILSGAAALIGGAIGLLAVFLVARTNRRDPRPIYERDETFDTEPVADEVMSRRPLHVREELEADVLDGTGNWDDETQTDAEKDREPGEKNGPTFTPLSNLTADLSSRGKQEHAAPPQDMSAARREDDIPALIAQFDAALASYREDAGERPPKIAGEEVDPLETFLARQAASALRTAQPSKGAPDNHAELRLALDKLVRARRND